ncbi:cation-transporting ATPase, partial [mine drainage metagenome]
MTQAWPRSGTNEATIATKGAPEAIARLCRLDPTDSDRIIRAADRLGEAGMRVLAVAEANWSGTLPDDPSAFPFRLLGLVGFADPLRAAVPTAIAECRMAGIHVAMITG